MPDKLTNEDIQQAVKRFWTAFQTKSEAALNSFYAPGSTVFQVGMGRSEPGRLGAMRRAREYFHADTRLAIKLGAIDVNLLGNEAAVASYTFQFEANGRDMGTGKRIDEKLAIVRATHVFARDHRRELRIVHEHFSVPVA